MSGAISRNLVAPGGQKHVSESSAPSTCSTVVRSGHHAGAVGVDGGGQAVQKQLIWESASSTDRTAVSQSFAAGRRRSTGCEPLKLSRHLLSHSGGKADGEEFELSLRV